MVTIGGPVPVRVGTEWFWRLRRRRPGLLVASAIELVSRLQMVAQAG